MGVGHPTAQDLGRSGLGNPAAGAQPTNAQTQLPGTTEEIDAVMGDEHDSLIPELFAINAHDARNLPRPMLANVAPQQLAARKVDSNGMAARVWQDFDPFADRAEELATVAAKSRIASHHAGMDSLAWEDLAASNWELPRVVAVRGVH